MRNILLIVDDSEFNREFLKNVFKGEYEFAEATNGKQALDIIHERFVQIAAVLLNINLPVMSGEEVLEKLTSEKIESVFPILLVTNEQAAENLERCLDLGAADFISKPLEARLIRKRTKKLIELFTQKNEYKNLLDKQTQTLREQFKLLQAQAKQLKNNNENILAAVGTIAEYRNMESSSHIENVKAYTRIIATHAKTEFPEYHLTDDSVRVIASASALHDIGKIVIPDSVLLKPAKLTKEEFELMCSHPLRGFDIIESITGAWDEEYGKYSKEIARSHHERYDGRGYPEGLVGEQIPVSAQIVGIADCFDAMLTDKVYKAAFSFEEAFPMILDGQCGTFSPKLMECFRNAKDELYSYYIEMKKRTTNYT